MSSSAPWRARNVAQLLDGGCRLLHRRARAILTVVVVVVVPVELAAALAMRWAGPGATFPVLGIFLAPEDSGAAFTASLALFAVRSLSLVLVAGPIAHIAVSDAFDHALPARQAWRMARSRLAAQLGAWCLAKPAMAVAGAVTSGIGTLLVSALLVVAAPAIAIEQLGPYRGLKRSWRLAGRRFGDSIGFVLLCALVSTVVTVAVGGLAFIGEVVQPLAALDWLFAVVAAIAASLVTVPIVVGATVLYYVDLRTRTEGVDLVIEAREVLTA
ncbi:MAG TPA: hypothetical protein VF855_05455 [Acidimicrobiales bacterium]